MAKWRPLHRNVTTSDKMLQLANEGQEFAQWLWTALLPYTDRAGRLNGNPLALLGTIFEGYPYTPEKLEEGLHTLARVGLVVLYRTARQQLLVEYTNFEDLNIFDKREAQSQLPGPTDEGSERITPAPVTATGDDDSPRETPKEATGEAQAAPRNSQPLHVHGDTTSTSTQTEHTSPKTRNEPPAITNSGATPHALAPPRTQNIYEDLRAIYNEHRGNLPAAEVLSDKRKAGLKALIAELKALERKHHRTFDARELLEAATKHVANDKHWIENGYNLDNLLVRGRVIEKAEKWRASGGLNNADRRLADKAQRVADAIGGLT